MTDQERWERDGREFGWRMPYAPWWKRMPVVRHFRALWASVKVGRHEAFWLSIGMASSGYDHWVLYGIATGQERHRP